MQVTKEQSAPCTVTLDFQIEPDAVSRAFARAYREFGNFTHVPGFRPGKAPRQVLERYVNPERLRERVMELVAVPAYQEALKQEQITPYRDPEVVFSDLADGQPWQFKAIVPTAPKVILGDYSHIVVERPVHTVDEEDVARQIERHRAEHARLEKVEGRGVQERDILIAEMSVQEEGQEGPAEPKRTLIRLGNNIPGFDEAILGLQVDEERTFTLTYPEDYQDPERVGKQATFTVKIVSINQQVLPELTDEWVRSVLPFQTVEELKADIREKSQQAMEEIGNRVAESRIIEQLVQRATIEFPPVLVEEEVEEDLKELHHELEQRRMTYAQYLEATGKTEEQHRAELATKAEAHVKSTLVLRELARRENIAVSDAEIDAAFDQLTAGSDLSEETLARLKGEERRRTALANTVVRRKLRDYLFQIATLQDVPAMQE